MSLSDLGCTSRAWRVAPIAGLLGGLLLGCAAPALGQSCPSLGVPVGGVPNWDERVFHVLGNAARISPAGYASAMLGTTTIMQTYPSVPPLLWDNAAGAFAHNFAVSVMTSCPANAPTHNSCAGVTWATRATAAGLCGLFTELVVATGTNDPLAGFNLLLTESLTLPYPADHTTDTHRQLMLSATPTTLGCGFGSSAAGTFHDFWVMDLQGSCTAPSACGPLHSGTHLVRTSTLDFLANYYDAAGLPPQSARLVIEGVAQPMPLFFGTAAKGTYKVSLAKTGACRSYYFEFVSGNGTTYRYPGSGLLRTFGDGCTEDFVIPKLVVNEIDYDQPGTDTAEFIEIKNVSGAPVDLAPYSVELWNGANNTVYQTINLSGLVAANGYFVISATGSAVPNTNQRVPQTLDFIQNGAPDGVLIRFAPSGDVMDALSYEGSMPGLVEGTALATATADDNTTANWGLSRFPDGTDTNNAATDWQLRTITPGASNGPTFPAPPPVISVSPVAANTCPAGPALFGVTAGGVGPLTYQWQVEDLAAAGGWVNIANGNNSISGARAFGASGALSSQLTVTHTTSSGVIQLGAATRFRCIVTNAGGSLTSGAAALTFATCACGVADIVSIGGSPPPDGLLTGDDFNAFINAFAAGSALADIVAIGGLPPPDDLVTGDDFNAFIAAFATGCP